MLNDPVVVAFLVVGAIATGGFFFAIFVVKLLERPKKRKP